MAMVAEDIVLYPAAAVMGGWAAAAAASAAAAGAGAGGSSKRRKRSALEQQCKPEPSIFTCGTCKSVYSSSWFLVQHVQKTHGLKIYEEPRESSPTPPSVPARPIVVQPEKLLAEQLRGGGGKDSPHSSSSPFHPNGGSSNSKSRPPPRSSPTCSPRAGSGGDMFSFPTPFMPGAPRQPAASWPYGRSPMGADFAAMMHPELMMDQLRRLQGMVGADHPAIPTMPFLRPAVENQYSHSERLRLLAASGSTSPKHIPPHGAGSRKPTVDSFTSPTQSSPQHPASAFTTPTSSSSHDTLGTGSTATTATSGGRQLKQCEFCNKQFRFSSNLVLHRRMHTGEKPYRCPLCSFTSAQATKLRTHMRFHVTSPASALSPQESKLSDSDIEDSEEFVQREAEAEAAIRQLERDAKRQKEVDGEDEPTDLSHSSSRRSTDSNSPAVLPTTEDEEDVVGDRASLLTEVMMKTGLSSLPNYKEAFTAALAEVPGSHNKSPQRSHSSPKPDGGEDEKPEEGEIVHSPVKVEPVDVHSEKDESIHELTDGDVEEENDDSVPDDESRSSQRRSPLSHASSEYSSTEPPEKRIKRESSPVLSSSSPSSFPGADHLFQRAAMEGLYPGIWFPPTSSAAGLPFSPFMHRTGEHPILSSGSRLGVTSENGVSPQASSAFSSSSPKLPSPDPSHLGQGMKRRNDTCEFCGKVFKNCSNLTVHRRSHTGEKPYKCQLCPYACAQSSKLTRHMRTHGRHGKDVYRCKFCCMPFSVPSTLEKHMRKCVENQQRAAAAARHLTSPLAPPSTV